MAVTGGFKNIWDGATWQDTGGSNRPNDVLDPFNLFGGRTKDTGPVLGQPDRPGYQTGWDPSQAFSPELAKRLAGINLNTTGLDKFRTEALRSGPSLWASLANNNEYAQEAAQKDRAITQARSGARTAEADLASKGGLSSGARERIARSGGRDLLAVGQDVARTGNLNRMQIGMNDEQNRITQLGMLPGMENTAYQDAMQKENTWDTARKADIDAATQENVRRQGYNTNVYNQQMQAWAANRQAQATENSGKK